ncbi:hypothetical protein O0L34_g5123 [Tuta absoluta]|nr:hypothetical protein O0L34_g5123 [Tuta absoluta]
MSTASSVGAAERRPLLHALVIERRILFGCTILVGLCTFVWIIAVTTPKWVIISAPNENGLHLVSNRYLIWSQSGLWETCRHVYQPKVTTITNTTKTNETTTVTSTEWPATAKKFTEKNELILCTNFLAPFNKTVNDPAYDMDVANYVRTMVSFGIIGMFVMAMGCGFSVYTFRNPRYMFKRLAAGIHFISTACTFVVVQVMMSTVEHFQTKIKPEKRVVYPLGADHYFHISFFLAWFVVIANFFASASFLWYSRKRKGDKAATDELAMADEPTIIGR